MDGRSRKRRKLSPEADEVDGDISSGKSEDDSFGGFSESDTNEAQEDDEPSLNDVHTDDDEELDDEDEESNDSLDENDMKTSHVKPTSLTNGSPTRLADSAALQNGSRSQDEQLVNIQASRSSMFQAQVEDLLNRIRPTSSEARLALGRTLKKLKGIIEQIPTGEEMTIKAAEQSLKKKDGIRIPFPNPRPPTDAQYKLQYVKPTKVNVAGSFMHEIHGKVHTEEIGVDLTVTMPKDIFQEKDYVNYRYFYKRAYFLACLAAGLKASAGTDFAIQYDYLHGNRLQSALKISLLPPGTLDDFVINVIPIAPANLFPVEKLLPSKNCIRKSDATAASDGGQAGETPFYNSTILCDMSVERLQQVIHTAVTQSSGYRDACILGRVWLQRRGLSSTPQGGGFGNLEWAVLNALLSKANEKDATRGLPSVPLVSSPLQQFKILLGLIAERNFAKNPVFHGTQKFDIATKAAPLFFDGASGINVLFKMTPWSYQRLIKEARATLHGLNGTTSDGFDSTFITRSTSSLQRYDFVAQVPVETLLEKTGSNEILRLRLNKAHQVLSTGLGDRVALINIVPPSSTDWSLQHEVPRLRGHVEIQLTFRAEHVNRQVDHGPSADEPHKAATFREFWGEKAELRRFKDGSISESLVWDTSSAARPVVEQIVDYLLSKHFGQSVQKAAIYRYDVATKLLPISSQQTIAPFVPIQEAFDLLGRDIRALEGMPLDMKQITPCSASLRSSSIDIGLQSKHAGLSEPMDVLLQFEGSGRWPDDLTAIQYTKVAFLLKLNELIQAHGKRRNASDGGTIVSRLGLENNDSLLVNSSFLEIAYLSTGALFRLRIFHYREAQLLQRRMVSKQLPQFAREEAAQAMTLYRRNNLARPALTSAIQRLAIRYPALSPTIRLVKLWFARHMLLSESFFSEELVELLAVRTFTHAHELGWTNEPQSATAGFLRTLLWISSWKWLSEPLIVDMALERAGRLRERTVRGLHLRFEAWRQIDPLMRRLAIFAVSSTDIHALQSDDGSRIDPAVTDAETDADADLSHLVTGDIWTDHARPPKVITARLVALASAACVAVEDRGFALDASNINDLFAHDLSDYDFVLHLTPASRMLSTTSASKFRNLDIENGEDETSAVFPPPSTQSITAHFVKDLRRIYADTALFFWDCQGGTRIAGLWDPSLTAGERGWKVHLGYNSLVTSRVQSDKKSRAMDFDDDDEEGRAKTRAALNRDAVLAEIATLGAGIVERVQVLKP